MSIFSWINFTAGELTPLLSSRVDLDIYYRAAKEITNFIPLAFGPIKRRPGLEFLGKCPTKNIYIDPTKLADVRLIPYKYSVEHSYALEFGDRYFSVITKDGYIKNNNNTILYITTPYLCQDIKEISYAQHKEKLYLCHNKYPPMIISLTSGGWAINIMKFNSESARMGRTYMHVSTPIEELQRAGHRADYRIAPVDKYGLALASEFINSLTIPNVLDSNNYVHLSWEAVINAVEYFIYREVSGVEAYIARIKGTQFTDMGLLPANESKASIKVLATFDSEKNYPSKVTLFDQRLILASTINEPNTIWGSNLGVYHGFISESTPTDTCSWKFTLASGVENNIRWLRSSNRLLIGTSDEEWRMSGTGGGSITANSVEVRKESSWGSADITPVSIGDETIFIDRTKKSIRSFSYSSSTAGYASTQINLYAEHLTRNVEIIDSAYSQGSSSFLYLVTTSGDLLAVTYDRSQQVYAWHKYRTDGKFISIVVIPSAESDIILVIVERTINGEKVRYVERFKNECLTSDQNDYYDILHLDSMLTYRGISTFTISGLDHLIGKDVLAIADGKNQYQLKVNANGSITLPKPATVIHVGLPFISILETLPIEAETSTGTMQTREKRITEITVKLENTLGILVGSDKNNLTPLSTFELNYSENIPHKLFSGIKKISNISGYDVNGSIIIKQDNALPSTIIGIYSKIKNIQE